MKTKIDSRSKENRTIRPPNKHHHHVAVCKMQGVSQGSPQSTAGKSWWVRCPQFLQESRDAMVRHLVTRNTVNIQPGTRTPVRAIMRIY